MKTKLDKFNYHEALHTAFTLTEFIDISLVQHWVFEQAPEEVKEYLYEAQRQLNRYYQWCAEQQDNLEDELCFGRRNTLGLSG